MYSEATENLLLAQASNDKSSLKAAVKAFKTYFQVSGLCIRKMVILHVPTQLAWADITASFL